MRQSVTKLPDYFTFDEMAFKEGRKVIVFAGRKFLITKKFFQLGLPVRETDFEEGPYTNCKEVKF